MLKKSEHYKKQAEVHDELSGFDIKIDTFGQMKRNTSDEKLKAFLDERVEPKGKSSEEE